MVSRSVIDNSWSVNDTSRVVRMMIVSDSTIWSITYNHHSDNSEVSFTVIIFL
jgi:hypothetical protein